MNTPIASTVSRSAARWRQRLAGALIGLWVVSIVTTGVVAPANALASDRTFIEIAAPLARDSDAEPDLKRVGILDQFKSSPKTRQAQPVALKSVASAGMQADVEPNGTFATATPITGTSARVHGNLWPAGDIDYYSFEALAGDRVYSAIMTSNSAGGSTDSQLTLLASDGTTVIEFDDDNGTFAGLSSSIAGSTIPSTGTYFLKVNDFTAGTGSMRGYELYLRVQSGTPTAEAEPNDTPGTANT